MDAPVRIFAARIRCAWLRRQGSVLGTILGYSTARTGATRHIIPGPRRHCSDPGRLRHGRRHLLDDPRRPTCKKHPSPHISPARLIGPIQTDFPPPTILPRPLRPPPPADPHPMRSIGYRGRARIGSAPSGGRDPGHPPIRKRRKLPRRHMVDGDLGQVGQHLRRRLRHQPSHRLRLCLARKSGI